MCIFDYILHACGHSLYRYFRPTSHTCRPTNICGKPSLETMGHDLYHLIHESVVSKYTCTLCAAGLSNPATDPFLKNLEAIVCVLGRDIMRLRNIDAKLGSRACQAVKLLSRLSEMYWVCRGSRPGTVELQEYITFAAQAVEKAVHSQGTYDVAKEMALSLACSFEQEIPRIDTEVLGATFSQGTIDRQLGDFAPEFILVSSYCMPKEQNPRRMHAPNIGPTHSFPARAAELPITMSATTPTNDFMKHFVLPRPFAQTSEKSAEDELVMTNPFSSPATATDWTPPTVTSISAASPVKMYLDGRDEWVCDFCGPDSFCFDLDD